MKGLTTPKENRTLLRKKGYSVAIVIGLHIGTAISAATLLIPYQYCAGGNARGFPFAIVHPTHGDSLFAVALDHESKTHGPELDTIALLLNITIWSIAPTITLLRFAYTRQQLKAAT